MIIEPRIRSVGDGTVRRLLPYSKRRMVGPFIFCDLMGPEELEPGQSMNVNAHPHIGLSTLTYLLEGRVVHRDSTGAVQAIEPGAVNWMTAGRGVTHTERSHPDDASASASLFGVQTWIALPEDAEEGLPRFEHCGARDVPEEARDGVTLRVAAGTAFGVEAPVTGSSPLGLAEISLSDVGVQIEPDHPERAILAMKGGLTLAGTSLEAGSMMILDEGDRPELHGSGTALMLAGEPVGPRHIWWNFVHSSRDRIEAAKDDWTNQRFPTVPSDHDPWVPLPS
ncbi:MAG: pirin family protein [Acidimicrobiales bacterium]